MAYLYPYGDTQQLNLDWLIEQWNEVKSQIDGSLQAEIDRVEAAITDLLTARDEAVAAQTAAQASAQAAAGSASTASGAASTATAQAQAAAGSAATAGAHASDAQGYAATAQQAAQAANNSASAAAVSEGNARNSETAAAGSSSAAAGNALYAEGYAKGTQNDTPVTSGSPYYQNNAKYYSDQAAQDASDAADSAQDAQDILDSIPADYTNLTNRVIGNEGQLTADLMPDTNGDLIAYNQLTPTAVNQRTVYANGNTFGTKAIAGKNGTTYYTFALSKNLKFIGNSDSNVQATLTLADFSPIEIPETKTLQIHISYKGKNTETQQNRVSGAFKIYTMDPVTLELSSVGFQGFSIARAEDNLYSYYDFNVIANDSLPQIYDNKNILIAYQSRNAGVEEEFTVNIGLLQQDLSNKKYKTLYNLFGYVENRFIATKPYDVNDCFVCGNILYIVTAPIAINEAITVGTNASETSVSQLLTNLLNN